MKKKLLQNTMFVFLIVSIILIVVLVFVIEIPFTFFLFFKSIIGASMIAMSYLYVMKQRE